MKDLQTVTCGALLLLLVVSGCSVEDGNSSDLRSQDIQDGAPTFHVDAEWPRFLPNKWVLGTVTGVAVDSRDHVWVAHAVDLMGPRELGAIQDPPSAECCYPAPLIIEFDPEGNVVQTWDDPSGDDFIWPEVPHGLFVDHNDYVWVGSQPHHQVLKFTREGEHVLTIGEADASGGSDHEELLGGPAGIWVDAETNEVFIADGYRNRRIVVFDGETGEYRRHWGAYGEPPDDEYEFGSRDADAPPAGQFSTVHGLTGSRDGRIYAADRRNNRIQVFEQSGEFVTEAFARPGTLSSGSAFDVALSPDPAQRFVYLADGTNHKVWIFDRETMEPVGEFGQGGRQAGQFYRAHVIDVDSSGNIYVGEVDNERMQKFVPQF